MFELPEKKPTCSGSSVERIVRPDTRGYTEEKAIRNGMHLSEDLHCPECGCPWYGNKNLLGEGSRVCCDCYQDWWTNIKYDDMPKRRELPKA